VYGSRYRLTSRIGRVKLDDLKGITVELKTLIQDVLKQVASARLCRDIKTAVLNCDEPGLRRLLGIADDSAVKSESIAQLLLTFGDAITVPGWVQMHKALEAPACSGQDFGTGCLAPSGDDACSACVARRQAILSAREEKELNSRPFPVGWLKILDRRQAFYDKFVRDSYLTKRAKRVMFEAIGYGRGLWDEADPGHVTFHEDFRAGMVVMNHQDGSANFYFSAYTKFS
jgi:hypothetical protein